MITVGVGSVGYCRSGVSMTVSVFASTLVWITGITTEQLRAEGGDPVEVLAATREAVWDLVRRGVPIAIYNAPYDWPLLAAEVARHHIGPLPEVPPAVIVDPLVLDRHVDRYRKGRRTLTVTAAHYGVTVDGAHRARKDALATVGVCRALAARYPALQVDGEALVAIQVAAYERWRNSFNR
jgi:DNA polymerase-3 subunit epsilon